MALAFALARCHSCGVASARPYALDLFVLVTIGILVLRAPPRSADFRLSGFPAVVLALSLISYFLSVALGLALPGSEGGSDNPYLRPDNALRLARGFFTALALLPFLRARMRTRGDTMVWFGTGMAAGLTLVAAAVLAERAVFTGLFDFKPDYRVVGTFSSIMTIVVTSVPTSQWRFRFCSSVWFGRVCSPFSRCSVSPSAQDMF